MWGRRRAIVMLSIIALLALAIMPSGSYGSGTYLFNEPGGVGGMSDINLTQDGHVRIYFNGTARVDVYFMTEDNYEKASHNSTYAYIQELSRFNVTSVDVQGDLPAGSYAIRIVGRELGNFTVDGPPEGVFITYPAQAYTIPWDTIAIVAATATATALGTYGIMRHGQRKK